MGQYTSTISRNLVSAGSIATLFVCPPDKTHAVVDITALKISQTSSSRIALAISTDTNGAGLDSKEYFIDDLDLVGAENSSDVRGIILGTNERLYAKSMFGEDVVIRTTANTFYNTKVADAGKLTSGSVTNPNTPELIYMPSLVGVDYMAGSIILYNKGLDPTVVTLYSGLGTVPQIEDQIANMTLAPDQTVLISNHVMKLNERLTLATSSSEVEYFISGLVMLE